VKRFIATHSQLSDAAFKPPLRQEFTTVAISIGIAQFVKLNEGSVMRGVKGTESLLRSLDKHLDLVARVVNRHGGDVFKFDNDTVLALWPPVKETEGISRDELMALVCRSAQCCLQIQEAVAAQNMELLTKEAGATARRNKAKTTAEERKAARSSSSEAKRQKAAPLDDAAAEVGIAGVKLNELRVKIGLGVGRCTILHLDTLVGKGEVWSGDVRWCGGAGASGLSRLDFVACGPPLTQAFRAERQADEGEVVVSAKAWAILDEAQAFSGQVGSASALLTNAFVLFSASCARKSHDEYTISHTTGDKRVFGSAEEVGVPTDCAEEEDRGGAA
jgi:class 3 adenylate cyclase